MLSFPFSPARVRFARRAPASLDLFFTRLVLASTLAWATIAFAACGDDGSGPSAATPVEDAGVAADADVSADARPKDDDATSCTLACFGGACPDGKCEPTVFVRDAGENVHRIRTSATRIVWSAGFGTGVVSSKPFDGGETTTVAEPSQPSHTFDVEGETLVIVHSPSGIYRYDVTTGEAIGTPITLPPGGIAPIGVLDGVVYFEGNHEGTFNPDGPNYYPLVSSPLTSFGPMTEHAKGIDGVDLQSILPTTNTLFFAGKQGLFRTKPDLTAEKIATSNDAWSLTTDGEFLYWVADFTPDGARTLMRSELDGSNAEPIGPKKVLSVAAIPGRLFYAVEVARDQERVSADIMVLGTKP